MKLSKFLFIALAMSFLFVRCEKNTPQEEAQVVTIDTDNDLLDEYELPVFPSEVLHVIHWRTWCTNVHSYIENANSPIFVDGDWTSWNSTTFTLSVIKDCDDIEDDRKNNFKKKKYIYLKP
jgi:hypothetical protein